MTQAWERTAPPDLATIRPRVLMNNNVSNFYRATAGDDSVSGHFHKVIALHEKPDWAWETIKAEVPQLPRGWYELCRLPQQYRIEFTRDYWLGKLPYLPHFHDFLPLFFENLEDVGVYLTQQIFDGPFVPHMVYSLQDDAGFFAGLPPASEPELVGMMRDFEEYLFPTDYMAFLQIHDGFCKSTDTGMIKAVDMRRQFEEFQQFLNKQDPLLTAQGLPVDPRMLLPFYESFGLHCYQCFFADWYPEQEMGNVYYSGIEHALSDFQNRGAWGENLAFPTFLDWLLFYLKGVDEL